MGRRFDPVNESAPAPMRQLAEQLRSVFSAADLGGVRELAQAAGLSSTTVSDAMGGSQCPSWPTVRQILKSCAITPDRSWLELQERAKAAERNWKAAASSPHSAQAVNVATEDAPPRSAGLLSLRPPLGELPVAVRGRADLLNKLASISETPNSRVQVLAGVGGCGKSAIALSLAQLVNDQGRAVFWIRADSLDRLMGSLRQLCGELGATDDQVSDAWTGRTSAVDLLWRLLDQFDESPWLLVFDNADNPSLFLSPGAEVYDGTGWIRRSRAGMTVVTSRVANPAIWGNICELSVVPLLQPATGAKVLMDLTRAAGTPQEAAALSQQLDGLPLALKAAGAYLARTARVGIIHRMAKLPGRIRTFASYADALSTMGIELIDQVGKPYPDSSADAERHHRRLVGYTWELTLDLLASQGLSECRAIMRLLSCFSVAPLPIEVLDFESLTRNRLVDPHAKLGDVERMLEALLDVGLIEVSGAGSSSDAEALYIACHGLVHDASAQRLAEENADTRLRTWQAASEMLMAASEPAPEEAVNDEYWRLVAPHCANLVSALPLDVPTSLLVNALSVGLRCFAAFWFRGAVGEASDLVQILSGRSLVLDADNAVRLAIRHRYTLANEDDLAVELEEYRDILERQRRQIGDDDPDTLITHHQFAATLRNLGRLEEAESELREVLIRRRRTLGAGNPYTLITHGELADLYSKRGDEGQAEEEYMALAEAATAAPYAYLPRSNRHAMAHILDKLQRYSDAEIEYRAVREELAEEGRGEGSEYHKLGRCLAINLRQQGRFAESIELFDDLVSLHFGPEVPCRCEENWVFEMAHIRGDVLCLASRPDEGEAQIAEILSRRALRGASEFDSIVLAERHCLAHALERNGKMREAEGVLGDIIDKYSTVFGHIESKGASARYCLARLLAEREEWSEAESLFEEVLAYETSDLGPQHSDTLVTRKDLYLARHALGLISSDMLLEVLNEILGMQVLASGEGSTRAQSIRDHIARLQSSEQ